MRRGQEPVGIMAGRGIANSGRSEGRVPGVRSRILRSTRLVSVNDAFRQQPLEGRDQTNRRRGCCGVSKGWVEPVVAAPFDDPDCRSAVVCHASRRSASPAATGLTIPAYRLHAAPDYESGGQEFESLRARHLGTKLGAPKPAVFALEAATSVRSSSLLEPMMRTSFPSTSTR